MSTTENTNAIDEKKAEESETSPTSPDFKKFIYYYFSSIVAIAFFIFFIGGLGLYTTKVAQANILPDDVELAPYTIFDRIVKPTYIDMNIMRPSFFSENKDTLSQKVIFNSEEYLDSFNNSFLCFLKKHADPNSGIFSNMPLYFSFVYDNLVAKNFQAINTIFLYLSHLPESVIMFLYGIFGIFIWLALYFFNLCISIFYHIINIPQIFRASNIETKKWESEENISFFRLKKLLVFFFLWIPAIVSTFLGPIFITIYGLISPLYASYKLKQSSKPQDKSFSFYNFIKNTFVYKKLFFLILGTLSLFTNGNKYLGNNAIIGIVFAVIFAYFMGLYTNEMPEPGVSGFTQKIKQDIIQSSVSEINFKNPKLVEVCQQIPIDDVKTEEIIKGIEPRELTKPIYVGGIDDMDFADDTLIKSNEPMSEKIETNNKSSEDKFEQIEANSKPSSKLDELKIELADLENELQHAADNVSSNYENYQYYALKAKLQPQIDNLKSEIKKITTNTNQLGGKTNKHKKQYNIRWT